MGIITVNGRDIETEDIDLLVRFKPLAELDGLVKADEQMALEFGEDPYWKHRLDTHKFARDIADWCFENDIPTVDLPKDKVDRTQGLYALEKVRELESEINDLKDGQSNFQKYVLGKVNERTDKRKPKDYQYK